MKILLTGATGFVGSHVARELISKGNEVYALVREASQHQFLKDIGVYLLIGSLSDPNVVNLPVPPIDGVIHLAGLIKAKKAEEFYETNAEGTKRLLTLVKKQNLKRFVFVSSISARGPNIDSDAFKGQGAVSHYGKSKVKAERIVLEYSREMSVIIFRPPIVYGPGDLATFPLFKMFRRGFFPLISGGKQRVSFIYVDDLAQILADSLSNPYPGPGPFYPEDGNEGYSWREVSCLAEGVYKKKIFNFYLPLWGVRLASLMNDFLGKITGFVPMMSADKFKEVAQPCWTCSFKGYPITGQLTELKEGLKISKEWYEREGWV